MTVSLIISTYNSPKALDLCLMSVLQQSVLPDVIIADERLFQLQMVQQPQRHPRVLGRDKIRLRKHLAAALGDIGQIADRRRHKIEHRAHGQSPFA